MDDEIEITDYIKILKKNWLLAFAIFFVIMSGAIIYTLSSTQIYAGRSLVMINSQDQTSTLLGGTTVRFDMETQREIIMSTSVLDPIFAEYSPSEFYLEVNPIKDSTVFEIIVQTANPESASAIANKVADSYAYYTRESKKKDAAEVSKFIDEQLENYKKEIDELNRALLIYEIRDRDYEDEQVYQSYIQQIDAKEAIYAQLLSRKEEVGIVAKEKSGNVRVIEYSISDYVPIKPKVWFDITLGVIISSIFAVGLVILKSEIKNNFHNGKEIESAFGQKIIGTISRIRKMRKRKYMIIGNDMYPKLAESMRKIRANLMLKGAVKVISITSPKAGEGKSLVASNLAISLASTGKKVMVVDANFRNPIIDKAFGVKEKAPGLAEILETGKLSVRKTKHRNVFVMTSGKIDKNSVDIVSADRIMEICHKLNTSDFDFVIIDNTSLEYAESTIFSANSKVVMVVSDKSSKEDTILAKETLESIGALIVGVVWNRK